MSDTKNKEMKQENTIKKEYKLKKKKEESKKQINTITLIIILITTIILSYTIITKLKDSQDTFIQTHSSNNKVNPVTDNNKNRRDVEFQDINSNESRKIEINNEIRNEIKNDNQNNTQIPHKNYKYPIGPEEYSETLYVPIDEKVKVYREKVKEMFHFSFDNYMKHAFPKDELKPLSCSGMDTWGKFSLTMIDALDTFAVMGDVKGFEKVLNKVKEINFDIDVTVSVFETTIRVLGGLLSSHLIAEDLGDQITYHGELLALSEALGKKLLPAFDTPTGMPYGSINLVRGVAPTETPITCTATISTCVVEFTWLSILTNDPIYEFTCRRSIHALWSHRSKTGLVGGHIDVFTGIWTEAEFSISGGIDSFYEYLLKGWIGFSDEKEYGEMFLEMYELIHRYLRRSNGWHVNAYMFNGSTSRKVFQSLGAFWPGVKVLAGELIESNVEINLLRQYLKNGSFLPENIHVNNLKRKDGRHNYPLRPELIESLSVLYKATKDKDLLEIAFKQVDRLEKWSRSKCGFANVQDVSSLVLEDKMESFFLSETLKYLYLLFDPENKINKGNYIFNTEAHPFPVVSSTHSKAEKYYSQELNPEWTNNRVINRKNKANKRFEVKKNAPICRISHWQCSNIPKYFRSFESEEEKADGYYNNITNNYRHFVMDKDKMTQLRNGICSYEHWIKACLIGLKSTKEKRNMANAVYKYIKSSQY